MAKAVKATTIHKNKTKEDPYTRVANSIIRDDRLSWKARGLMTYLMSLPDDWIVYISELVKHAPDGKDSLTSGMNELRKYGYVSLEPQRDPQGRITHWQYEIYEEPQQPETENPLLDQQEAEKPEVEKPEVENPQLQSTDITNEIYKQITEKQQQETPTESVEVQKPVVVGVDISIHNGLEQIGVIVSEQELKKWISKYGATYVLEKIQVTREMASTTPLRTLRAAIKDNWKVNYDNSNKKDSKGNSERLERVVPAVQQGKYERFYQVYGKAGQNKAQ